jgi:hypothetical protein
MPASNRFLHENREPVIVAAKRTPIGLIITLSVAGLSAGLSMLASRSSIIPSASTRSSA